MHRKNIIERIVLHQDRYTYDQWQKQKKKSNGLSIRQNLG